MAMVTVTDRAAEEIRKALVDASPEADQTLRLVAHQGSFALALGKAREGDEVIQSEEADILVVAPELTETMGEITIDWRESAAGGELVIHASR